MEKELEAKFLDIDPIAIRAKLHAAGANLVYPERLMKRNNFDFPDLRLEEIGGWVRIRDEGDRITLSYKQRSHWGLTGTDEVEVVVSDFRATHDFLTAIGLEAKAYQETKREKWLLGECEVTIDTWPWIPTTLEIEGRDETAIKAAAIALELDWTQALHGDIAIAYMHYFDIAEEEIYHHDNYSFDSPCPWELRPAPKG